MEIYFIIAHDDVGKTVHAFRDLEELRTHLAYVQQMPAIAIAALEEDLELNGEATFDLEDDTRLAAESALPVWEELLNEDEQEAFARFTMELYRTELHE